jgi:hypothetical protein
LTENRRTWLTPPGTYVVPPARTVVGPPAGPLAAVETENAVVNWESRKTEPAVEPPSSKKDNPVVWVQPYAAMSFGEAGDPFSFEVGS